MIRWRRSVKEVFAPASKRSFQLDPTTSASSDFLPDGRLSSRFWIKSWWETTKRKTRIAYCLSGWSVKKNQKERDAGSCQLLRHHRRSLKSERTFLRFAACLPVLCQRHISGDDVIEHRQHVETANWIQWWRLAQSFNLLPSSSSHLTLVHILHVQPLSCHHLSTPIYVQRILIIIFFMFTSSSNLIYFYSLSTKAW